MGRQPLTQTTLPECMLCKV